MMASGRFADYLGMGVIGDRPAAPVLLSYMVGLWYSTDTLEWSAWNGSVWLEDIMAGGGGTGVVETIVAGTGITVDSTDPANPIVAASGAAPDWGDIGGTLSDQTDLQAALDAKATDRSTVTAVTPSAGTATFDYSLGDYFTLAPTANVTTLAFSNMPGAGHGASLIIRFTQDSSPRTVAWPASFKWAGGTVPAVSTGSGVVDLLAITTFDNGTTWRATLSKAWS